MHKKKLTSFIMTYACATVETYNFLLIFKYGYLQPYAGSSLYPWPLATPTYVHLNIHIGVHRYMPVSNLNFQSPDSNDGQ